MPGQANRPAWPARTFKAGITISAMLLASCGDVQSLTANESVIGSQTYPDAMPAWLSQGLELCRLHQLHAKSAPELLANAANDNGWTVPEVVEDGSSLTTAQQFVADGGRYLYSIRAVSMTYGPEIAVKCQFMQMPEPFGDPLPEDDFAIINQVEGMQGEFELYTPCRDCPDVLLGQWAWRTGGRQILVSAHADTSSLISILFTDI